MSEDFLYQVSILTPPSSPRFRPNQYPKIFYQWLAANIHKSNLREDGATVTLDKIPYDPPLLLDPIKIYRHQRWIPFYTPDEGLPSFCLKRHESFLDRGYLRKRVKFEGVVYDGYWIENHWDLYPEDQEAVVEFIPNIDWSYYYPEPKGHGSLIIHPHGNPLRRPSLSGPQTVVHWFK